jgi:hypothetical protein
VGYDLHITRADYWTDHALYPISLAEWVAVADAEPRITRHREGDKGPNYTFTNADGESRHLGWWDGMITIWKGHDVAAELAVVAQKLGARLVGDEFEEYHTDGGETPWSAPRAILFDRPLNVDEAAVAWETIFDRQDDDFYFWRPGPDHARHAFGSFRVFAAREVAAADVPDADGLLYQYGPSDSDGEQVFTWSLVRQLATDTQGAQAQVECRLKFTMTEDLAGLGSFHQWWFPEPGTARDEWFDAIASRPEWRLLNSLTPLAFTFDTNDVC